MRRPNPSRLDEVTAIAETWLRRCEGEPVDGVLTSRSNLRMTLAASTDVAVHGDGTITWVGAGRQFSAGPVRDDAELTCERSPASPEGEAGP